MSIVVGIEAEGQVWLAGDSLTTIGKHRIIHDGKRHEWPNMVLAFVGCARIQNLIGKLGREPHRIDDDIPELMATLRAEIIADGWTPNKEEGDPQDWGVEGLIASRSGLWHVASDFAVLQAHPDQIIAIGSGREYAAGAAAVLDGAHPEARLDRAVEVAIALDDYCGGPVWQYGIICGKPHLVETEESA